VLITPANSLFKQVSEHYLPGLLPHGDDRDLDDNTDELRRMRESLLNIDGVGVAWYTNAATSYIKQIDGPRPALYKSQSPPIVSYISTDPAPCTLLTEHERDRTTSTSAHYARTPKRSAYSRTSEQAAAASSHQ
jgi:hypothetical protein